MAENMAPQSHDCTEVHNQSLKPKILTKENLTLILTSALMYILILVLVVSRYSIAI
jgi:hypothetical protein